MYRKIIHSNPDSVAEYFSKIWHYKSLIWVFAKRDLKIKYAQTILGVIWTLLQPLASIIIFSFFFGYLLNWQTKNLPYPIYVLSGLLGWNFFSYIVYSGSSSIQESGHLIKKIYFPKSILPLSKVVIALVELLISLFIFIPIIIYYEQAISWKIVFIPIVLLFNAICGLTLVFWVAALAYKKRDLFHTLPLIVNFGIWITPVFFIDTILPNKLKTILQLNPMTNVIEMWRWVLFGEGVFNGLWLVNFVVTVILCLGGMLYFNKNEHQFSDFS